MDLLNDLTAHDMWANVTIWSNPKFINLKEGMAGATVVVSVVDDNEGNVGRRLMGSMVNFSGVMRPCKRWVDLPSIPFCNQCQKWGHPGARCSANVLICSRCAGTHDYRQHDRYCSTCQKGPGHACRPRCNNCFGPHMSTSHECPYWLGRTSKERHSELDAEIAAKFPKERKKGGNKVARRKVGFAPPDSEGFSAIGTQGIAHISPHNSPVAPPQAPPPPPPASLKPASGSVLPFLGPPPPGLRDELSGNSEAERLLAETLLDEAAFAAADAAGTSVNPSGSPPLNLSYA